MPIYKPVPNPFALVATGTVAVLFGLSVLLSLPSLGIESGAGPATGAEGSRVLVAWTAGGLPDHLPEAARKLPGVADVAVVRGGTGWISAWAPTGAAVPLGPPPGYLVPVDVAVVEPEHFSRFLPEAERARFRDLLSRGGILGRTGAGLRGIESAGSLQFGPTAVPIAGVLADDLVRNHEVVVPVDRGAALRLMRARYMLVGLSPEGSAERVEEGLRRLAPPGARMGVRKSGNPSAGSVLSLGQIKARFGEFPGRPGAGVAIHIDPAWVFSHTVEAPFPIVGIARCHREVVPQLMEVLSEIEAKGLGHLISRSDFGGCFAPRFIRSGADAGISHHAWGIAFDINVSGNLYGHEPTLDHRIVEVFEKWGFVWGGRWLVPDGMHFEYVKPPARRR